MKTRLGEYREGAENSGLSHREVLLSLAYHDQVPYDQTHREQDWSKEDDPEHVDTDLPAEASLNIPMQEWVGVTEKLLTIMMKNRNTLWLLLTQCSRQSNGSQGKSSPPLVTIVEVEVGEVDINEDVEWGQENIVEQDSCNGPHGVNSSELWLFVLSAAEDCLWYLISADCAAGVNTSQVARLGHYIIMGDTQTKL